MTLPASADTIAKARAILGAEYDPSGKTETEVMRAAVSHHLGVAATSTKSPEYLRAALDVAADMAAGRSAAGGASRADSSHYREDAADRPIITRFASRTLQQQARSDAARDLYCYNLDRAWQSPAR